MVRCLFVARIVSNPDGEPTIQFEKPTLKYHLKSLIVKSFFSFPYQDECQNYIRVLAQTDTSSLLVCGTNSFKPRCRTYTTIRETPQVSADDKKNNKNSNQTSKATTVSEGSKKGTVRPRTTTTMQPQLIDDGILRLKHEFSGTGICPLDPSHNSTAIFTGK